MQPQNSVLNRIDFNVVNWIHVCAIEFKSEEDLTIHFTSGFKMRFTNKPTIRNIMDMVSVFPDINHEPTREKMKKITIMNNPMNMHTDRLKREQDMQRVTPERPPHFRGPNAPNYEQAERIAQKMQNQQLKGEPSK